MREKVLVTGASGFAGRYICKNLAQNGFEVYKASISQIVDDSNSYSVNISDLDQVSGLVSKIAPDYVIHLAAISFVGHGNIGEIYETNLVGTRNLLQAIAKLDCKPKCVLLTSSANVYGNTKSGILDEDTPFNPVNDYALSKVAMEYLKCQFNTQVNIAIARPFNFTGVGQSKNFIVPKIIDHFKRKCKIIELGNIDIERDFSDVRVVAQQFVEILKNPNSVGETFNICSGHPTSLRKIINLCEEKSGYKIDINVNPAFVRANDIKTLAGNGDKYKRLIGINANTDIDALIDWMLKTD